VEISPHADRPQPDSRRRPRHTPLSPHQAPQQAGVLAAQQTNDSTDWYQGTADAVRQQIRYVEEEGSEEVLVLSGDQLYRMDFRHLLQTHRSNRADATIAVLPVTGEQASSFGIMRLDENGRVIGFVEKPQSEEQLRPMRMPEAWIERHGIKAQGRHFLASMGIYLFNQKFLIEMLNTPPLATDFGKDVFPRFMRSHHVQAHLFDGYWEDLGTIKSYHDANLALAGDNPPFDFHSPDGVIFTRMRFLPASRITAATVDQCLISDGCVILPGSQIHRSVIGVRSHIGRNVALRDCVVIGADRYETETERAVNDRNKMPSLGVGDGAIVERAILDKDSRVGRDVRIQNRQNIAHGEGPNYVIRDGIVVIPRGTAVPDGTVI
jgi:glucose-1-phosphate adenylyltransferase